MPVNNHLQEISTWASIWINMVLEITLPISVCVLSADCCLQYKIATAVATKTLDMGMKNDVDRNNKLATNFMWPKILYIFGILVPSVFIMLLS